MAIEISLTSGHTYDEVAADTVTGASLNRQWDGGFGSVDNAPIGISDGGTGLTTAAGLRDLTGWPPLFLEGLELADTSATTITVQSGNCRSSTDDLNIKNASTLTAVITTSGAGGLDTGAEAASTWYAVHIIADSNEVSLTDVLLSLSATAPTQPTGYDRFRFLGWVFNDSSSDLLSFTQKPFLGFDLTYLTASTVTMTAGECTDTTGLNILTSTTDFIANFAVSGAGGLDTGVEAASTFYAVHVIGSATEANNEDTLISLSDTAPTLPAGYGVSRHVGWVFNDVNSDIRRFIQLPSGRGQEHFIPADNIADPSDQLADAIRSVVGYPPNFLDGLKLSWTSVTAIAIAAGNCRNSDDTFNFKSSGSIAVAITTSGAGGLDTGAEAADTWYAVHVIADSLGVNAEDGILSLSDTAPTLPSGYDKFRRVGWVRNDVGLDILPFIQMGSGRDKVNQWHMSLIEAVILSGGSAAAFTSVDASTLVPTTVQNVVLRVGYDTSGSSGILMLRTDSSQDASPISQHSSFAATGRVTTFMDLLLTTSQTLEYKVVTGDDADLHIYEWTDEL